MRNPRPLRREVHAIDGDQVTVRELSAAEMQSYLLHLRRINSNEQIATDLLMLFACYGEDGQPWLCSPESLEPPRTAKAGELVVYPIDAALEQFRDPVNGLPGPVYMKLIGIVNRVNDSTQAPPKN